MKIVPALNEIIHSPVRLRIASQLRRVEEVEFAVLRDTLGVSDATLSKNLKVLADAGFATVSKGRSSARNGARRLTWLVLTPQGKAAFDGHIAALRELAAE